MAQKFHQRFNIPVSHAEAQRRFLNRVHNLIWDEFMIRFYKDSMPHYHQLTKNVIIDLGERYKDASSIEQYVKTDFFMNLRAIEALYSRLAGTGYPNQLDRIIETILAQCEIDLGIRWNSGHFLPAGAPTLDDGLVNDVLGILTSSQYKGVSDPFVKGLDHFLNSIKKPELLSDVVTDMYEAVEALAKIVCRNDKVLSANREALVPKLSLSNPYKNIVKEYIEYANDLHRHAGEKGQPKSLPSSPEVEAFLYLTGLVIRLALSKDS